MFDCNENALGVHTVARNNTKSTATVAKWKLQDATYLQNRLTHTTSQIEKLQACLSLSAGESISKQTDSSDDESAPPPSKRKKIVAGGDCSDASVCVVSAAPIKVACCVMCE